MTDRLSALEAAYLTAERPDAPLHVGSVGYFEAAPFLDDRGVFKLDEVRAAIGERLGLLPRLRQRLAEVPLDLGRPVWVDDEDFDISRHVVLEAVPAPGDEAAVMELVTRRYCEPLDRRHPLWSLMFVTGLANGRVALLERVHHALADGIGGVGLATVLLDLERNPAPTTYPAAPAPQHPPAAVELVRDAVHERVTDVVASFRAAAKTALDHPLHHLRRLNETVEILAGDGLLAPRTSLNAPIGERRQLVFIRDRLERFKSIGDAHGATVNDVVLAVVTAALRAMLIERGEPVAPDSVLKALVPVSYRAQDAHGALGNEVAGLVVPLPIGIGDSVVRLEAVVRTMRALKESGETSSAITLVETADLLPPLLLHLAHGAIAHQPLVNLVVTNVPGPPIPLYAHGSEMLEAFPIVPLAGNLTLGVAVLSYNGQLNFGVTVDPDACPDSDVFVREFEAAVAALSR